MHRADARLPASLFGTSCCASFVYESSFDFSILTSDIMDGNQMSDNHAQEFQRKGPPPAPPPPPARSSQQASIALKVREASEGWGFVNRVEEPVSKPPAGKYFFYGTLQDPGILSEVLSLDFKPALEPASVIGCSLKLWGQYPALVDKPSSEAILGSMFEVPDERAAAKLAYYETNAYRPRPVSIYARSGSEEVMHEGYTFLYAGNPADLSDGTFDLDAWLRRMGRGRETSSA